MGEANTATLILAMACTGQYHRIGYRPEPGIMGNSYFVQKTSLRKRFRASCAQIYRDFISIFGVAGRSILILLTLMPTDACIRICIHILRCLNKAPKLASTAESGARCRKWAFKAWKVFVASKGLSEWMTGAKRK